MPDDALMLRPLSIEVGIRDCVARLPFRFGVHTMRAAPLCTVRVRVETPGGDAGEGFASDLLVPRWFEKTAGQTIEEDWRRLLDGISAARTAALGGSSFGSVFGHWRRIHDERMGGVGERHGGLLVRHGVSLMERALIDAACRLAGVPFWMAMRDELLGFDAGALDPSLEGEPTPMDLGRPRARVHLRHTVGLVDALRSGEEPEGGDPGDGLPATLEDAIRAQGLTHFKIKVGGDAGADLERLERIAGVIREGAGDGARCTLDGNEQFGSMAEFADLLEAMGGRETTAWLRDRIVLIEQPVSRTRTFDSGSAEGIARVSAVAPVIIDEADSDPDALLDAAALGYGGVSVKNCKGVFGAVLNAVRCRSSGGGLVQSGEDLTNLPVVALQQDLATSSALGLTHVERNGHQYFAGLGHLGEREREAAVAAHRDLYEPGPPPRVRIEGGMLELGSIHETAGYGYGGPVDFEGLTALEDWSAERLVAAHAEGR